MPNSNQKRTLDEEPIRRLLTGLVRSGRLFYRPDPVTGLHSLFPARLELTKLGMSQDPASRLLKEAVAAGLIKEVKINHELEQQLRETVKASKTGSADDDDDDKPGRREPDEPERPFARDQNRYELVTENTRWGQYFGVYDSKIGFQEILSQEREVAMAEIQRRYDADEECRKSKLAGVK